MKGGAQEGKQDPGADFEEKTLILEVPRNENKILGQTEEKHQSSRCPAREKKRSWGRHCRKTSILDVPRKENKILGQTLNKSIDRIGAQQEKKKILGQTWQENINPGCAQKEK